MKTGIKNLVIFSLIFLNFLSCQNQENHVSLDLRDRVKKIVLENGMTFLLLKRGNAPVFSARIKVKVGTIDEERGQSGLAHFFEHMAFKGTQKIGSKDFLKEKEILDQVLEVGTQIIAARKAGKMPEEYASLEKKLAELETQQNAYIEQNEFVQVFQKNGGVGLNAGTSNDDTTYIIDMPVNKLELWAYLESERFLDRVFREFFKEVDVVTEERRQRIENSPFGKLLEKFMNTAFQQSPYGMYPGGLAVDIKNYTPKEAREFYEKYYIPSRMVGVLVGNFDLEEAEKIVRHYFGRLPKKTEPQKKYQKEIFDNSFPRKVTLNEDVAPRFYMGFHRPAYPHPDDTTLDVMQYLMCLGRSSRLYKKIVIEEQKASYVSCSANFPGTRLDSVFQFFGIPLTGVTNQEVEKLILEEIQKLATTGPTEWEMERVKNQIDGFFLYSLQSNDGLADQLASTESLTKDWSYIYDWQEQVQKTTTEDIKRVAQKYFLKERQVSVYLEPK